jgi:hypothetical protein
MAVSWLLGPRWRAAVGSRRLRLAMSMSTYAVQKEDVDETFEYAVERKKDRRLRDLGAESFQAR